MPEQAAPVAAGQEQQPQGGNKLLATVFRMAVFYFIMQWFKGGSNSNTPKDPAVYSHPVHARGSVWDIYAFVSEQPDAYKLSALQLMWEEKHIALAVSPERTTDFTYYPSKTFLDNGTLYMHVHFVRHGEEIDTTLEDYKNSDAFNVSTTLNTFKKKPKAEDGMSLLSDGNATVMTPASSEQVNATDETLYSWWKPNVTINMVDHFQPYPRKSIPPQLFGHLNFNFEMNYLPIVVFNEFWLLRDKLVMVNDTVTNLTVSVSLKPLNFWFWNLQLQMEQSFAMQRNMGLTQEGESDELKRILLEGNPYLLGLTMFVSLLHSVFDFLAFKNDIGFWKNNKSMEGLSARSILINAFCQLVIFLYLLDNETSFVVLISSGIGTAIEFWKVTKAMDVSVQPRWPYLIVKDRASYRDSNTDEHDRQASRYLAYVLYPLVIGYAVYTLLYQKHKSWYSWVLGSLVGAVYTFGFILMCPQLYLNYKLKSVAHLPWRQMTYKFLNTIIDDLFAFVIKMPTLHRLSVFRDDLVFLVYLYQRWAYPIDKTRVNEFGYVPAAAEEVPALVPLADGDAAAPQLAGTEQEAPAGKRKDAAARTTVVQADTQPSATESTSKKAA